jgi:hypothetical protein
MASLKRYKINPVGTIAAAHFSPQMAQVPARGSGFHSSEKNLPRTCMT